MATERSIETEPTQPELDDFARLIAQAREGGHDALEELIRTCQTYLLLIANDELDSQLRGKLGASDVVQSALVLAEQNIAQFRGDSKQAFLAWLRAILRNELNAVHRKYIQTDKRDLRRERNTPDDSDRRPVLADDQPTPGTEAVMHEEAVAVREALSGLSEDHRRVLILRNWERLSFEEIGEQMNRSADAAKKLWARAIERLRQEFPDESV